MKNYSIYFSPTINGGAISSRCCICGPTGHSLRRCLAPFNVIVPDSRTLRRRSPDSPRCSLECPAEALLRTFKVIVPDSRTLRRRSPDSPLCTLECPAEALLRTFKVIVLDSRTLQTTPQSRPNLLRPRAPLALAQPSRLLLPCVMALRFRVTPTQTPADQVRSRCHLLLLRDGSTTVPHRYPCLRHYPTDAPLLLQLIPTHRYLILDRHCDRATPLSPLSLPPRTEMTHQPGRQFRGVETLVQTTRAYRCSVPLAIAPPHGHATTSVGSSGFSAGLVSLSDIHELPLDDSSGEADSKVDAHPPYPIQIGVCPQSRQTPDLGTPASQLPAVGHTRDRAATGPAAVIPHHFLDAENAFLNREEDPPHSSWASCSEPPAPMHNTNATADLSTCYGTSATLGQHKACPDRDDSERTRPVTTPSVPPSHDLRPSLVPLEHAYANYDASLTYINDDVVLFWHPPSVFSQ